MLLVYNVLLIMEDDSSAAVPRAEARRHLSDQGPEHARLRRSREQRCAAHGLRSLAIFQLDWLSECVIDAKAIAISANATINVHKRSQPV